jgi:hypothetical protein
LFVVIFKAGVTSKRRRLIPLAVLVGLVEVVGVGVQQQEEEE